MTAAKPPVNVDNLVSALAAGNVKLKFTKVDGSVREGVFTTKREIIDASGWVPAPAKPGAKPRAPAVGVINVFETSTKSWKSFRASAVLEWAKA